MAGMKEVEVVVAHSERATLRVGDVFLQIDADQARADAEVEAMALAPIRPPEILWRKPPVLAIAALPGQHHASASRRAGGVGHVPQCGCDAPAPPWRSGRRLMRLNGECGGSSPAAFPDLVTRNRRPETASGRGRRSARSLVDHVFVDGDDHRRDRLVERPRATRSLPAILTLGQRAPWRTS
jgi:hypothetical protein